MTHLNAYMLMLVLIIVVACTPSASPNPVSTAAVPPTPTAATTTPLSTATNPPAQPTATVTTSPSQPTPVLPAAAPQNSSQALENVAQILYAAWASQHDLKPYLEGVMTAFGVPPLGADEVDLADTRLKQALPLMFKPQVAEMADAFNDGGFMSLDSFIAAANERGAKQRGTNNPLTREYLTLKFANYTGITQYELKQVLPAFVLALSKQRAKHVPPAKPDPLWGDGLLDPLQVTLLLYSISYAGAGPSPAPTPKASGDVHLSYRSHDSVNNPLVASWAANVAADPIEDYIKDQLRGKVTDGVQDLIEVPLDEQSAVKASVCGSLLLYGHKLKVTSTPKLLYHKNGAKPSTAAVEALLTFEDDYWDNYLPIDRWIVQNLADCKLPRRGPVEGKPLVWSVSDGLKGHGNYDITPAQTGSDGKATASWKTIPETTPESQRTFQNQRDAVGAAIVRASGLVPGWSTLERIVGMLRDTNNTGDSPITVIYYQSPFYRAHGFFGLAQQISLTGNVCALDQPFTIRGEGLNGNRLPYAGTFAFTPSSPSGGNWTHTATTCAPKGCGVANMSGTYQLEAAEGGKQIVKMSPALLTTSVAGVTGSAEWPAWQFELEPAAGVCPKE